MPKFDGSKWDSQIYTAKDALTDRPPREYLIKPLAPLPSLIIVYGPPGCHKTNLMIDLAVCVAMGKRWLVGLDDREHFDGYEVSQAPVMWLDQDSGIDILHERFGATLRAHKGTAKTPIHYMSFPVPSFAATNPEAVTEIIKRATSLKCGLLLFDNLITVSGGRDENSYEMNTVMNNLRLITNMTRAIVIAIHHAPKSDSGRKSSRGHGSIQGSLDLELHISRDKDDVTIESTKTRNFSFGKMSAFYTYEHKRDTTDLRAARFFGQPAALDLNTKRAIEFITKYLRANGPSNQSDIIAACKTEKIGQPTAREALVIMEQNRLVSVSAAAHNSKIYTLNKPKK